jgi:two-component system NtrC family sensor kinase
MNEGSRQNGEKYIYAEALREANQKHEELVGELSVLKLLNDSIQVGLGFSEICQKLVQFLTGAMNVENASVMVFDPEKEELRLVVGKSLYEYEGRIYDGSEWKGKAFKLGEGIAGQAAEERKSILINDARKDPRFVNTDDQKVAVGSLLCLPLIHGDHLHGVLNLSNSEPNAFTMGRKHALHIIASTASAALSQAVAAADLRRLNEELTAQNRKLGAVVSLSESLHRSLDINVVLSESMRNIADGFDVEAAGLFLRDEESRETKLRLFTARSGGREMKELLESVARRWMGRIMESEDGEPFIGPVGSSSLPAECTPKERMCVGVPLLSGRDCFGMLLVLRDGWAEPEEAEILLLSSFCRQISAAVHNSILVSRLKENIAELKETKDRLIQSDKLALLGEMVSGVAHEINNPLAAIMGYSELLLDGDSIPGDQKIMLEKTISCVERCRKIVQGLLSFARKTELEKKPTNINDIIDQTIAHREYDLALNNIEVIKNYEIKEPIALVDPNQMEQVFLNLLNNAFDSMAGRDVPGILEITTSREDDETMRIELVDNGCGISEEDRPKLFEPFFTTKEIGKGTGLGLSVSYGIVSEHEGSLFVDEAHYCGAKFVITLPFVAGEHVMETPKSPGESADGGRGQGRVLIVDDEEVIVEVVHAALSARGFSVDCAYTGEEAYALAGSNDFDLIISDIRMPGPMDGQRLYHDVKERDPEMADRFVFISGDVMEKQTAEFLSESGRAYLLKPFSMSDLNKVVENTLKYAQS